MGVTDLQPPPPRVKRWTKREYNDLVERGAFQGQRVYLFRGELIETSPQYHPHAFAVTELTDVLHLAFGIRQGFKVRIQLLFDTPGPSMPEPDGLVCTEAQGLRVPHPCEAVLVVEVADSSLAIDREKALDYAAARVPEYWIIDVNNRCVEVYRNSVADPTAPQGFRYPPPTVVAKGGVNELLAKPGSTIPVDQFFHDL
jgi:Uma2 family endonuclease